MNVLALDPGGTTGLCLGTVEDGRLLKLAPNEAKFSIGAIYNILRWFTECGDHIIYEDFQYRNYARMGLDLTPVKIIGVIELFREWHEPFIGFHRQSAATGKAFYSDDTLKKLGVYQSGKQHGRDAMRHLLQWANFGAGGQYLDVTKMPMELVSWAECVKDVGRGALP